MQRGELPVANFRIAGVDLTKQQNDVLEQAARIFGRVESAASGDGAEFDESVCYRSSDPADKTHLFFGKGEMDSYYTLATGAGPLKERQLCRRSRFVSQTTETASGIRLGSTTGDLISALGLPTRRSENTVAHSERLVWDFELKKKTSAKDLAQIHKAYPKESETEIRENYAFYWQSEMIKATFTNGRLTEVTVDWLTSD